MKLSLVLLIFSVFQVSAYTYGQRIDITVNNASFESVLLSVQAQSGYNFLFKAEYADRANPVTLTAKDKTIHEVLSLLMASQPFDYHINGNIVTLVPKVSAAEKKKVEPLQNQIRGVVTDSAGTRLEGVSVLVKGTSRGTATDVSGSFQIQANPGDVLVFRNVGYIGKEVVVGQGTMVNVSLMETSSDLEEVVVVAYGAQKKATLTGAVATIRTKDIKQSPAANLAVTLAGRLPGLFVQQISGEPGRDVTELFMRGRGTVNGSAPIILVDGVERELTAIDPNEVETVSILKDASSTALFGVRGANGVILVTTKRGSDNEPAIGLTVETGLQTFTRWPSRIDGYNWALLKNQAWKNDTPNPGVNDEPPYSDYALERFRLQDEKEVYPDNNWIDILMRSYVPQTRYNLNLNGKGPNVGYFVNVGFLNQSGQWKIDPSVTEYDPSQYMKRYNFRSNIDAKLNKSGTLKTFLNASGFLERVNGPYVASRYNNTSATVELVNRILRFWPSVQPGPTTPGDEVLVGQGSIGESPWGYINRTGYRQESRSNLTASWGLEQDLKFLVEGLSTRLMVSFDTRSLYYLNGSKQYQYWVQVVDPNTTTADGRDSVYYQRTRTDFDNTPLSTSTSSTFQSFYEVQWHLNYNRTFQDKHAVTGLLMGQQQSLIKPNDALPFNVRGLATRITYGYDSRYFAEFNAGFNGSEQFAEGRRYGFFPSFSAGWNIHEESFFESLKETVNLVKIRGSYGEVGGDRLGSRRFLYLDDIQRGGSASFSQTLARGSNIDESFFGNSNVKWEVAKKSNIGFELGLFDQLTITADVFHERRDNVLISRGTVPMLVGVPSSSLSPVNIGIIENKGYELQLDYSKMIRPDLSILAKVNFNHAANTVIFNDEVPLDEDFAYRYRQTGYQIGQQWGYRVLGLFNSQEEIDAYGVTYEGKAPRPGDLIFEDVNGDKIIDQRDIVPIGQSDLAKYNWGAAANISFKSFDLSLLFQGAFGVTGQWNSWETNDFRDIHSHAWTPERAAAGYDILYPALSLSSSSSQVGSSFFNESRSFVRLKNAELGYKLPKRLTDKVGMRGLRVYANGLNLFTWDRLSQKDWDPELGGTNSFPVYRIVNLGINATF